MEAQALVLLISTVVQNASLGHYSSSQFITQLHQWSKQYMNYIVDEDPHDNWVHANVSALDTVSVLTFKKEEWEEYKEKLGWKVFAKSYQTESFVTINIQLYYVIYSFFYKSSVLSNHPNIFQDLSTKLFQEGKPVEKALQVTSEILKQSESDKDDAKKVLSHENFQEQFRKGVQTFVDKLKANKISDSRRRAWFFVIFLGVAVLIFGLLGVVGNVLSIIVLVHTKMRSSFSVLLIGLAVSDIIFLIRGIVFWGIFFLSTISLESGEINASSWHSWGLKITQYVMRAAMYGSMFFTMAITVERYLVVCHPTLSVSICTWRNSVVTAGVIFILANLANLPFMLLYSCKLDPEFYSGGNRTFQYCEEKENSVAFRRIGGIVLIYDHFMRFVLPMITLLIFNGLIYFKIREYNLTRKRLANSSPIPLPNTRNSKEYSLTRILFAICIIFMLTNIPLTTTEGLYFYILKQGLPYTTEVSCVTLSLYNLQFSLNFLIYFVYGTTFRTVFSEVFCRWGKAINQETIYTISNYER